MFIHMATHYIKLDKRYIRYTYSYFERNSQIDKYCKSDTINAIKHRKFKKFIYLKNSLNNQSSLFHSINGNPQLSSLLSKPLFYECLSVFLSICLDTCYISSVCLFAWLLVVFLLSVYLPSYWLYFFCLPLSLSFYEFASMDSSSFLY